MPTRPPIEAKIEADRGAAIEAIEELGAASAAGSLEAGAIVRAIATKLNFSRVTTIGYSGEGMVQLLGAGAQAIDVPSGAAVDSAHPALQEALLVIDAHRVLAEPELLGLVREARAAVLLDSQGRLGMRDMRTLVALVEARRLSIEHRSFVRSPVSPAYRRESPFVVCSDGRDDRLRTLLAAGAKGLALDPSVDLEASLGRPVRVCVASYEVVGPTRNGGIGTANTSLALALGQAGHDVTLLFTGRSWHDTRIEVPVWRDRYGRDGVHFDVIGDPDTVTTDVRAPHYNVRRAYEFYQWLVEHGTDRPFDVVHFPECQGHGHYAVLAKREGLNFAHTMFVAGLHSPTLWCEEANRSLPRGLDALVDDHLERVSVELADAVISPSAYMLDYLRLRGWKLPKRQFVQQYILPRTARPSPSRSSEGAKAAIEEVVFFGRLEVRKGVDTFCDALDRLAASGLHRDLRITFLGRPENVRGEPALDYVARRAQHWPWPYQVLSDLDQPRAMDYLRKKSCLAVMPSPVDNSPNTVSEALSLRIPLIASRGGGTGELIDPVDLDTATFPGLEPEEGLPPARIDEAAGRTSPDALFERIRTALSSPSVPGFAVDHDANEEIHVRWHVAVAAASTPPDANGRVADPASPDRPTLSIGILHRDDDDTLLEGLAALREQREEILDVLVVDDGSSTEAARRRLLEAEDVCAPLGWQVLRQAERNAAAARGQIVAATRGQLLVFLRASDVPVPGMLMKLRDVAARVGGELLSWPSSDPERHYGPTTWGEIMGEDDGDASRPTILAPIGGPALAGLVYPAFASGPYAISREALTRIDGFSEDAHDVDADYDVLNRAVLAGFPLWVVPDPLSSVRAADAWRGVRCAFETETGAYALDREQAVRIVRPFARADSTTVRQLPGLHLNLQINTSADRIKSMRAYKKLDNTRHSHAEYIQYLEIEHRRLSALVHELQAPPAPHWRQRLTSRPVISRVKRALIR